MLLKSKLLVLMSIIMLLLALMVACAGQPAAPQVVKETVVVEKVVKETVEVTKIVEVETVITATPEPQAEATEAAMAANTTIFGDTLPEDAAPYDMQVLTFACNSLGNETTFDWMVSVYNRNCMDTSKMSETMGDTLVDLDADFNVIPASAESWEVSEDGLTWTFHIKPGLQWSDETPLTAYDYETTYQLAAKPEQAWDLAWFYSGVLKNWDKVVAGELPPTELGIKAVDDLTLAITTENPWPALPAMMKFSYVMQKQAIEKYGPLYNSDLKTSISAGPFMLDVFKPGERIELVANPYYKGYRKPLVKRLIGIYQDPNSQFVAFQNHEIDYVQANWLSPADIEIIQADPVLKENYLRHQGDFRTDYLLFDTYTPPFNDLKVRKAFAQAVDRESIIKNVFGELKAMPAHAFLMPGFPASDTDGTLSEYQAYDCEAAKKHLAEAGFPEGKDFPPLEMWLRNESTAMQSVWQAVAASIQECLGVSIEVSNKDAKAYMEALNAKPTKVQFGAISYGMDYLDPSNMLGIWVSTGRHSWKNEEFEKLVIPASSLTSDPAKRLEMFKESEKILVDDVAAVFIDHRMSGEEWQPYINGSFRKPDANGFTGWHWGNDHPWDSVYVTKDVENYNTFRTQ